MRIAKRVLFGIVALVVLGCSPLCRMELRFELPKSAGAIDYAKLHLRGRVSCNSFDLSAPKPEDPMPPPIGLEEKDPTESSQEVVRPVSFRREGDTFELWERASRCKAAATAWYDTNGNGTPDLGDFVARMPTTEFYDRGLCAGNITKVGPLDLEPWKP